MLNKDVSLLNSWLYWSRSRCEINIIDAFDFSLTNGILEDYSINETASSTLTRTPRHGLGIWYLR